MKWNSIRTKLIVFMLLATIIPIVTTMVVTYSYTVKSMKTRAVEDTNNLLYQGQRNVSGMLEELNRGSLNAYSDSELYRQVQSGLADFQTDSRVFASLSYILSSVSEVHQVYLYASSGQRATIVTNVAGAKRASDIEPFEDAELYVGSGDSTALQPTHLSHTYGFSSLQPQQPTELVFTLHRRIERIPSSETLGYLSIDVRLSLLSDIVEQLYDRGEEDLYIVDGDGAIIYSDDNKALGKQMQAPWYEKQLASGEERGHFEYEGALFVYDHIESTAANWTLIKRIPTSYLIREANEAAAINMLLLAVSLIVVVAATIMISLRITAPIKQLVKYMNQVQTGNLNVDIHPTSKDEIGFVVVRFRSMMDTINNLIVREYKLELANKTNELRALQAQINPHFLNNTIQIIGTLALELKVPRIYALLSALARLMRYSMDNESGTIKLRKELAHLEAYIELQKERYENRFTFEVKVEDTMLDVEMPKMILQPIIENYFKHGMDKSAEDGSIRLMASWQGEDKLALIVENNGASIPQERLEVIHEELARGQDYEPYEEVQEHGEHAEDEAKAVNRKIKKAQDHAEPSIGLLNVLTRMRMLYGTSACLDINNAQPGGGIRVKLVIPIKQVEGKEGLEDESSNRG